MNETQKNDLWAQYSINRTLATRELLIVEYAPLVKLVAGRLSMHLGYHVEYEDLVSYGIFGLIDAIDKYDIQKGIKFETYASLRIRGSILDHIRKLDWIPRSIRQKQKKIDTVSSKIESELGRMATEEEIAKELEISIEELEQWNSQTKVTNIISLEEFVEQGSEVRMDAKNNSHFEQPEKALERTEVKKLLVETLECLTEKEKKVIVLYYYEELTLKEISNILEVTESRISQLHTRALQKMKIKLGNNLKI